MPPSTAPLRLLCLHGCEQDRIVMENKCDTLLGPKGLGGGGGGGRGGSKDNSKAPLVSAVYIDAPFMLPKRNASDQIQMRTWRDASSTSSSGSSSSSSSDLLPAFVPPHYTSSVAAVLGYLLEESYASPAGPITALFGFSEGCMVACYAAMCIEHYTNKAAATAKGNDATANDCIFASIPPLRAVFLAAPPPLPLTPAAGDGDDARGGGVDGGGGRTTPPFTPITVPIMCYIGKKDAVVTPAASRRLLGQVAAHPPPPAVASTVMGVGAAAASSSSQVVIFEHGGAHMVPYGVEAHQATKAFIEGRVLLPPPQSSSSSNSKANAANSRAQPHSGSTPSSTAAANGNMSHSASAVAAVPPQAPRLMSEPVAVPVAPINSAAPPPPRYAIATSAAERKASAASDEWQCVVDEVDVLRSMFGDGEEAGDDDTTDVRAPSHWHTALKDAKAALVEASLQSLSSVVAVPGGAQCLVERCRYDLDAAGRGGGSSQSSSSPPPSIIGQLLVPILTRGALADSCGPNVPPIATKQLSEMGEAIVACMTILKDYPNSTAGGDDDKPAIVVSIISGVPRPATHLKAFKALLRGHLPELVASSAGCPMLLQLTMAASEGVQSPLTEYYAAGCIVNDAGEAGPNGDDGANGAEGREGYDSEEGADNSEESRAKRVLLQAWAEAVDEEADVREERIEAARRHAMNALAGVKDWRRKYCGRQSTAGGTWDLCFGLVGKPSAGKSSFFSAASKTPAKVGSYPFTTIEPNVSPAFAPMQCPCRCYYEYLNNSSNNNSAADAELYRRLLTQKEGCGAEHSCLYDPVLSTTSRVRRQPVLLKDVAGLVKGAYKGSGKGNRFLNDLCDADVLIHVVDGAGATNADGWECNVGEGNPLSDVEWIRNEVHSWVFDNVRAKWDVIRRRPLKFKEMFSGYRASMQLVDTVLGLVGVRNTQELTALVPKWRPEELHRFVSLFIFVRFPMVLAVNKMDLGASAVVANGERIAAANPMDIVVCLSAKEELARNEAIIKGLEGGGGGGAAASLPPTPFPQQGQQQGAAGGGLVTFGLQNVLLAAVEACRPIAVYPLQDMAPLLQGPLLQTASSSSSSSVAALVPTVLTTCALIRPGTSVESAKASFLNIPNNRKLVRIEMIPIVQSYAGAPSPSPSPSPCCDIAYPRKALLMHPQDEFEASCFLHVMTNAKAA